MENPYQSLSNRASQAMAEDDAAGIADPVQQNEKSDVAPGDTLWPEGLAPVLSHIEEALPRPRSVCQGDNRENVHVNGIPYRYICSLIITAGNGTSWEGTGFFIGERCVITAGHCIYDAGLGGWSRSIKVIPGRQGNRATFGAQDSNDFRTTSGWVNHDDPDMDVGAIILPDNTLFNTIGGYLDYARLTDTAATTAILCNSGYPLDKRDGQQWLAMGRITSFNPNKFEYLIDTAAGSSGSPVYTIQGGKPYVVGVHAYGGCPNSAVRVRNDIFDLWQEWSA